MLVKTNRYMKMQGETIKMIENYNYTALILAKWYIRRKKCMEITL